MKLYTEEMKTEFIPYDLALELKELGFNENCFRGYMFQYGEWIISDMMHDNICPLYAPLYQQAFRWFREKYGLMGIVDCFLYPFSYTYNINDSVNEKIILWSEPENDFETYEEAEKALLIKLIELVKQN